MSPPPSALPPSRFCLLAWWPQWVALFGALWLWLSLGSLSRGIIVFTSGTTGLPRLRHPVRTAAHPGVHVRPTRLHCANATLTVRWPSARRGGVGAGWAEVWLGACWRGAQSAMCTLAVRLRRGGVIWRSGVACNGLYSGVARCMVRLRSPSARAYESMLHGVCRMLHRTVAQGRCDCEV